MRSGNLLTDFGNLCMLVETCKLCVFTDVNFKSVNAG